MHFIFTYHATQRMSERNIPDPLTIELAVCKNRIKKIIRDRCKKNGYKSNLVYYRGNQKNAITVPVYVCEILGIAKYQVITVFWLDLNK